MNKEQLNETAAFIKEHRSNEANFHKLYLRLEEELKNSDTIDTYHANLQEVKDKAVEEYKKAKETSDSAWPEFEKFVSGFEKAIMQAK